MQTIIKELSLNPSIQEIMFNADITQVFNQTWMQILFSGILGSLIGGGISGGITWFAMKNTDKIANARWEKSTYKNFECKFWLEFYKEFHIINRFLTPFLKDIILYKEQNDTPTMAVYSHDNGEEYFNKLLERFNKLFDLVNGYEDFYLPMMKIDKTHIWIIWTMRTLLEENITELRFDKHIMLPKDIYKKLYKRFQALYWDNIKESKDKVFKELKLLLDDQGNDFDAHKLFQYFEKQLQDIEKTLKNIINANLLD